MIRLHEFIFNITLTLAIMSISINRWYGAS